MMSYEHIYQDMRNQLESCKRQGLPHLAEIEYCFEICYRTLNRVEKKYASLGLKKEEKVFYLKNIRPAFVAQMLYYELLYHAAVFVPESKEEARKFWLRELERLEKFTGKHPAFYQYYKNGRAELDDQYFTEPEKLISPTEDVNKHYCPLVRGDQLLSQLLCLEQYTTYVERQLELLLTDLL